MFCRRRIYFFVRLLSLGLLTVLFFAAPSSVHSEDFRILLVRDGELDRERQRPAGEVIVKAGYLDGIEVGMIGTIWRKNKYKGQVDIADLEVTEVGAYEATCKYTVRHKDFFVLKKDKIALEPANHSPADILATAVDRLGQSNCFDALLLFENIFCASTDNAFVQAQISECVSRVNQRLAEAPSEKSTNRIGLMIRDYLELATRHHKYKNDLAADLYLKRITSLDADNAKAAALREVVPNQNYAALLSPERCD